MKSEKGKLFPDRLKEACNLTGGPDALAKKSGVPRRTLGNYISGDTEPKLSGLMAIAEVSGVSLEWLMRGEEPMMRGDHSDSDKGDEFVYIDNYAVEAAAGAGAENREELVVSRLAFRRDWIRKEGVDPSRLTVITAKGDSMEPTIRDGETLLLEMFSYKEKNGNRSTINMGLAPGKLIPREGIYVVRLDDHLIVKRLQLDMNGGLIVKSDNPAYDKIHIREKDLNNIKVVGRVIWASRTL